MREARAPRSSGRVSGSLSGTQRSRQHQYAHCDQLGSTSGALTCHAVGWHRKGVATEYGRGDADHAAPRRGRPSLTAPGQHSPKVSARVRPDVRPIWSSTRGSTGGDRPMCRARRSRSISTRIGPAARVDPGTPHDLGIVSGAGIAHAPEFLHRGLRERTRANRLAVYRCRRARGQSPRAAGVDRHVGATTARVRRDLTPTATDAPARRDRRRRRGVHVHVRHPSSASVRMDDRDAI